MTAQRETTEVTPEYKDDSHRSGHGWMMIACCIPMLAIAIALVATGTASPGFLLVAIGCTVMMALMMRGMAHGGER
jgi:drug/metabolite transporter (DMT)-like permease